ncbi:hypothetical protein ACRRTK_018626 [Alexandromys fortis]
MEPTEAPGFYRGAWQWLCTCSSWFTSKVPAGCSSLSPPARHLLTPPTVSLHLCLDFLPGVILLNH